MTSEFPFDAREMSLKQANLFMDIYLMLKKLYVVEVDFDFKCDFFANYAFFGNRFYKQGPVFRIDNPQGQWRLCFPSISYAAGPGQYGNYATDEYQPWAYCKLKQNFGHIFIKTETFLDEIHNMFVHVDIKFADDPSFSNRFWVAADDAGKARAKLSPGLRDIIKQTAMPEPVIEMHDMECLIGQERTVTKETSLEIAAFMANIAGLY